ncbi:MAG: ATP-binding cassette domain-containing protein [Burkholderiaceae bacterium]|nr:ATP-binding cassette domain-containing protein [Burkholderiaceae bacterium]
MALIELRGVSRRYTLGEIEVRALDGISLAIEAGEFVAIMGQSGSGKSTLMNVLGCLDSPTEGQFLIDGQDAGQLGPDALAALRRERFGFIFQRYHLLPHLDARGNAALPAVYAGISHGQRSARAQALLQRLGLGERLHHRPNELSGGQQQRVSIARALMNGGQIILADEPTGALDSASGAEMLGLLKELHAAGHTIILVTHDPGVAAHARRVIELRDGHVVRDDGTPAQAAAPAPRPAAGEAPPPAATGGWLHRLQVQWREALATAWLSLQGNRLRSFLSMLGISIGIASVVSIVALTSAARSTFEGEFMSVMSGKIWIWRGNNDLPPGAEAPSFRLTELDALRGLPGVSGVQGERQQQMLLRQRARDASLQVRGADRGTLIERKLKLDQGRFFSAYELDQGAQVLVLDEQSRKALFKDSESPLGKTVLLSGLGGGAPGEAVNAPLPFVVIGTVKADSQLGFNFGNGNAYVPERTYIHKIDSRPSVDAFSVQMDFSLPPDEVLRHLKHRLRALRGLENFSSWSGDSEFRKMQSFTAGFAALFAGVGAIALLVGGVGVMNIMLVSVSERTREIGIRMAVGARQADVRLQFLIEAVLLCCLGGLVGVAFSWAGAQVLNAAQDTLQVRISWAALGVAFAVSSGVGLVFGTVPARRAAAMSPVDALARE